MSGDRNFHVGILGGGLAGSFLAAHLLDKACQVTLFDDKKPNGASRVAAGLFNVITGRFGAKTWMAETFLSSLKEFFDQADYAFLRKYLHEVPIYRPFKEPGEFNKWTGRTGDPKYAKFVRFQENPFLPDQIHNPLGGIWVQNCGWLDTHPFLEELTQFLCEHKRLQLIQTPIPYESIDPHRLAVKLGSENLHFDAWVFCEGYHAQGNPFLDFIQLIPNKGELLEVEIPGFAFPGVLSRKVYLIPLGEQGYLAGSTYQNQFDSLAPTKEGRESIEALLRKVLKIPFSVLGQYAGVRPTTPNRRPIVGRHPDFSQIFVLNGLGTKGVLQAPYFAKILANLILGEESKIPLEANIARFRESK